MKYEYLMWARESQHQLNRIETCFHSQHITTSLQHERDKRQRWMPDEVVLFCFVFISNRIHFRSVAETRAMLETNMNDGTVESERI